MIATNAQFRHIAILTVGAYFAAHGDPFWLWISCGVSDERSLPIAYRPGASKVRLTACARFVSGRFRTGHMRDIPRPKVDAIDLLWLGESTSEGKKSVEANGEGQEASHSSRKLAGCGA